jgi:hypothetical protein
MLAIRKVRRRTPPQYFCLFTFAFCLFSPVRGPKNCPAIAGAVSRRHKGQCAVTLAVLDGRLLRWEKAEKMWAIFGDFREFFALRDRRRRLQRLGRSRSDFRDGLGQRPDAAHRASSARRLKGSSLTFGASRVQNDQAPPRRSSRCCQVTLVSVSRSNCLFDNALWNSCHLRESVSIVRFWSLASISRQPVDREVTIKMRARPPCLS